MTDGTPESRRHLSRRRFLLGAAALAVELTVLASCGQGDSSAIPRPPRTSTPSGSAPPTTPPIPPKQPLEVLTAPLPDFVRAGPTTRPRVALTVDDLFGTAGANDLATLLDIAKTRNVQLTFFPTGGALEAHLNAGRQDLWQRAIAEGHEIGNHGYTHRPFTQLSDQALRTELTNTQRMLDRVLGPELQHPMRIARPPGGAGGLGAGGDPRIMAVLRQLGLSMVMWTIDSNGTAGNSSYLTKIVRNAANGSIVLTHFPTFAVGNFPGLIDRLRDERHLEPTNVSGLFA